MLRPQCQVRDLCLWSEVYLQPAPATTTVPPSTPPSEVLEVAEENGSQTPGGPEPPSNLVKTKSVDSLFAEPPERPPQRRLSDSSLKGIPTEVHPHDEAPPKHPAAARDVVEEPLLNGGPSIESSTDTLVNEAGRRSSFAAEEEQQVRSQACSFRCSTTSFNLLFTISVSVLYQYPVTCMQL